MDAIKGRRLFEQVIRETEKAWYGLQCDPCLPEEDSMRTYAELKSNCYIPDDLINTWLATEIEDQNVLIQGFNNVLQLGTAPSPLDSLDVYANTYARLNSDKVYFSGSSGTHFYFKGDEPLPMEGDQLIFRADDDGQLYLGYESGTDTWLDTELEDAVEGVTIDRRTKGLGISTKSMILETINPKTAALQLADEYEADVSPKGFLPDGQIAIAAATLNSEGDVANLGYVIALPNGSVQTITRVTGSSRPHQTMQNQGGRIKLFSNTKKLDNSKGGRLSEIEIDGGVEKEDDLGNVTIENPYIQIRSPRIELRGPEIEVNSTWGLPTDAPPPGAVIVTPDAAVGDNVAIWKTLTANHVGFTPPTDMTADNVRDAIYEIDSKISGVASGTAYLGTYDAATNTPDIITNPPNAAGSYYIADVAGGQDLNSTGSSIQINTGDHVIWSGTEWDVITGSVDLTAIETRILRLEGFHTTFPTVQSTPRLTGSVSGASTTMEAGTEITPTFNLNFNAGRITNGDGSAGPDLVGPVNTWEGQGPVLGNSWTAIAGSTHTAQQYELPLGRTTYSFRASYDPGTGTYTEESADGTSAPSTHLDAQRAAGSVTWSYNVNGRLYAWAGYGVVPSSSAGVRGLIKQSGYLDGNNRGSFTLFIPQGQMQITIACPVGREPTSVVFRESLGSTDIADQFTDSGTIAVNTGGGSGPATDYKLFVQTLKIAYNVDATYDITIG